MYCRIHSGKNEIGQFLFTEVDNDLIGSSNVTDPFGATALWSYYGRQIIPNFTEQTHSVYGFHLLVLNYYLYQKYLLQNKDDKTIPLTDFFKIAEQIFAFSYYERTKEWNLRGKNLLVKYYEAEKPYITLKKGKDILRNQISNGTYGLYRGAAFRSRILDEKTEYLSRDFFELFNCDYTDSTILFRNIRNAYEGEFELKLKSVFSEKAYQLFNTIKAPNKRLYKQYLINQHPFLSDLSSYILANKAYFNSDMRSFFLQCSSDFPSLKEQFYDMIKCEDVISTMDAMISFIYYHRNKPINLICKELEKELSFSKVKRAFEAFSDAKSIPTVGISAISYMTFMNCLKASNYSEFLPLLFNVHKKIAEARRGSPWAIIEGDRVKIFEGAEEADTIKYKPGYGWKHDYYFSSLLNVSIGLSR